jgi:hypothetical protein
MAETPPSPPIRDPSITARAPESYDGYREWARVCEADFAAQRLRVDAGDELCCDGLGFGRGADDQHAGVIVVVETANDVTIILQNLSERHGSAVDEHALAGEGQIMGGVEHHIVPVADQGDAVGLHLVAASAMCHAVACHDLFDVAGGLQPKVARAQFQAFHVDLEGMRLGDLDASR